ncbi:MAG: redoxin domain-containing protein, partial [Acidobacteria bacterium]|nr:redoxin domain-containing protein [Acidobacteriota bacterium]
MKEHPELAKPATPVPTGAPSVWLPLAVVGLAAAASLLAVVFIRSVRPAPAPEKDLAAEARADLERRKFRPLSGPLQALLTDADYKPIPTQTHPLLGQTAPDFTLDDTDGKLWTLSEKLKDGPVVLVFYYGYNCNHCVSQLFGLNKDIEKFRELGATVVAVSADAPELTRERYKKYGAFAFPVLSDAGNKVAGAYGTFTPSKKPGEDGDLLHGTFVIDRLGRVLWANRGDGPFTENRTLL